jgi:peroxiredoxin family protein
MSGEEKKIATLEARIGDLETRLASVESKQPEDRVSMVVFSGDLDRVLAAFVIATGAAAMGQKVSMFFTFWGLNALRRTSSLSGKSFFQKMMAMMSPSSTASLPVSKMNYFGVGARMLRVMMKQKNVTSLEDLITLAGEMPVKTVACEMSRDVMGIGDAELREGIEHGGVATFLADALQSRVTLFI